MVSIIRKGNARFPSADIWNGDESMKIYRNCNGGTNGCPRCFPGDSLPPVVIENSCPQSFPTVLAGGDALAAAGPAVRCRRCRWRAIRKLYSYSTIERTGFLTRAIVRKRFLYKEEKGNFLWKIMANKEFVNRIF